MKLLANAHTILSFVAAPGDLWSDNVRRLAPDAHVSFINSSLPENFAGHLGDWLVEQWGGWPAAHAAARQILQSLATRGLPLARSSPGASASSPSSSAILHPGAGSAAKCWPKQKFLELARRLTASGRQVHVLLGEVEAEQWPREEIAGFESVCAVHFPKTCVELLSHLADADVFVGNDSGPSHLAGMIGAPTIALFGPTDPAHWKPLGPRVRVLMGVPDELSVDNVMQAAALV